MKFILSLIVAICAFGVLIVLDSYEEDGGHGERRVYKSDETEVYFINDLSKGGNAQ